MYLFIIKEEPDELNPYMNYLFHPRLTFTGTFHADVSTLNNIPSNYDTANFVPSNYLKRTPSGATTLGQIWNSGGSGEWDIRDFSVTQVCYFNGTCVADTDADPILNANALGMSSSLMYFDIYRRSFETTEKIFF